jgi:hypothetical protein
MPFGSVFGPRRRRLPQDPEAPDVLELPRTVPARDVGIRAVSSTVGRSLGQGVRISEARAGAVARPPERDPYGFGYNPKRPRGTTENASVPNKPRSWLPMLLIAGGVLWISTR